MPLWQRWACLGAFMVPGLSLALPSGYSYGAVLLLLGALASSPQWLRQPLPRPGWALVALFAAMALLWLAEPSAFLALWPWRTAVAPLGLAYRWTCTVLLTRRMLL